jgi:hypothetical protein
MKAKLVADRSKEVVDSYEKLVKFEEMDAAAGTGGPGTAGCGWPGTGYRVLVAGCH